MRAVAAPRDRGDSRGSLLAGAMAGLALVGLAGTGSATPQAPPASLEPLQPLIDAAAPGDIVAPKPGRYAGPVLITKPLTLDGGGKVIVDGRGKGTVVTIKTHGATVRGLRVTASGDQHNDIDAGIRIEGNHNVVKDNTVTESLFGIDLQEAHNNVVRRNIISSKGDVDLGVKGDAIRLWYARGNMIEENEISNSRDLVIWYSSGNTVARNRVSDGRYGLHFMYANNNLVEDNNFDRNAVGIYMMYDEGDVIRRNRVFQALGAAGVGIGLKEASNVVVEDNEIIYNAVGMAFDITPFQPGSTVRVARNRIAFNDIGVSFLSDRTGNIFNDNLFLANTQQVAMRLFESAARAEWHGNYWDDYEGFDRNRDGTGDTPHALKVYADRLWMDIPNATFFKGSPALSALDFVERLAPFTEPLLLLKDSAPRMSRDFKPSSTPVAAVPRKPAEPVRPPGTGGEPDDADGDAAASEAETTSERHERIDPFGLYKK